MSDFFCLVDRFLPALFYLWWSDMVGCYWTRIEVSPCLVPLLCLSLSPQTKGRVGRKAWRWWSLMENLQEVRLPDHHRTPCRDKRFWYSKNVNCYSFLTLTNHDRSDRLYLYCISLSNLKKWARNKSSVWTHFISMSILSSFFIISFPIWVIKLRACFQRVIERHLMAWK